MTLDYYYLRFTGVVDVARQRGNTRIFDLPFILWWAQVIDPPCSYHCVEHRNRSIHRAVTSLVFVERSKIIFHEGIFQIFVLLFHNILFPFHPFSLLLRRTLIQSLRSYCVTFKLSILLRTSIADDHSPFYPPYSIISEFIEYGVESKRQVIYHSLFSTIK